MFRFKFFALIVFANTVLVGCAVGPDYHSPNPPLTSTYTESGLPTQTARAAGAGGTSQRFISGEDIPAKWWTLFHSQALNDLIRKGLANSPNLEAAQAALRQARENLYAGAGSYLLPSVNAQIAGQRENTSEASFGIPTTSTSIFNLYNTSVSVTYALDLFGGARRALEGLLSSVDYQRFQLEGTYLALTSNIVTTAITEASLRAQIKATHNLISLEENHLQIVDKQFRLGSVSQIDVLTQQTQLAQTRAALPPLEKSLAQIRDALSVLIGTLPSESHLPSFDLNSLQLPTKLPVSMPSLLVRQRPDVRASEALLHQASAQIGVATANMFPQFTLTGNYGTVDTRTAGLFVASSTVWNFGAQLIQPIFHGGALMAQRRAAIAAYDQAFAQYRQTVLQAFQNVADTLNALQIDARALQAQAAAETAAHISLMLAQKQFRLGAISYLVLLTIERQYQQAHINRIQAQATRYADTAALFQALGGGWWK